MSSRIPNTDFHVQPVLTRRLFLQSGAASLGWGLLARRAKADGISGRYAGLKSERYLGEVHVETEVKDRDVFTEGPAVDRAGNVFFTNVHVSKILKWDPQRQQQRPGRSERPGRLRLSVFRANSNETNGLLFEPDGSLLACEGGAGRVTRTNMHTGEMTVLAEKYHGLPLAAPNDVARDAAGRIYFTSRPHVEGKTAANAVYRIDPDGTLTQLLASPRTHMPNGIVTSPDDTTLYLIEAHPDADHYRNIRVFDLDGHGNVSNGRVLIDFYPGRSGDGMCIDTEGNLYVAAGLHERRGTSETLDTKPGIHVISPDGKLLAYRETPVDTITNCTFGGEDLRTLYIACGKYLLSLRTEIPGKPAYRPRQ